METKSRSYFDREERRGARVIFQWKQGTRWPADKCQLKSHPNSRVCEIAHDTETLYEGCHFMDEESAARFDLYAVCHGGMAYNDCDDIMCTDNGWWHFKSWEDAERWLNGERFTADDLVKVEAMVAMDGKTMITRDEFGVSIDG